MIAKDDDRLRGGGPLHDSYSGTAVRKILTDQTIGRNSIDISDREPCLRGFCDRQRACIHSHQPGARANRDTSGPALKFESEVSGDSGTFRFFTDLQAAHGNRCGSGCTVGITFWRGRGRFGRSRCGFRWRWRTYCSVREDRLNHATHDIDSDRSLLGILAHSAVWLDFDSRNIIAAGNYLFNGDLGVDRVMPGKDTVAIPFVWSGRNVIVGAIYPKRKNSPQFHPGTRHFAHLKLSEVSRWGKQRG